MSLENFILILFGIRAKNNYQGCINIWLIVCCRYQFLLGFLFCNVEYFKSLKTPCGGSRIRCADPLAMRHALVSRVRPDRRRAGRWPPSFRAGLSASLEAEPGSALRARRSRPGSAASSSDLVGEFEVADDGVVEALGAGLVGADVVRGPAGAERLAAGGELADEVGEVAVVRVAAGFGAQDRDGVVGGAVPVDEEAFGARVEEDEAGVVGRPGRVRASSSEIQRAAELVGGEDVEAAVAARARAAPVIASSSTGRSGRTRGWADAGAGARRSAGRRGRGRRGGRARRRRAGAPRASASSTPSETPRRSPRSIACSTRR